MQCEKSKLFLPIFGKTVIEHTVDVFDSLDEINRVIVVCREQDLDEMKRLISSENISFVIGGDTRQESVKNAVNSIENCDYILIHDGARPLITEKTILSALNKAIETGAAAAGVFVKDTIKIVDKNRIIIDTPDRSQLIAVHTPQIFDFSLYKKACEKALAQGKDFTDDCCLMENMGYNVHITDSDYSNIKITTPDDLPLAEALLKKRGEA